MRFFLLDRITNIDLGTSAKGIKAWSYDNVIFQDHFPGFPVVPGVLQTESMAQLLGLALEFSHYNKFGKKERVFPFLSIIEKAKFRGFVRPGDICHISVKILSIENRRGQGLCQIHVKDKLVSEATITFMITAASKLPENKHLYRRSEFYNIVLNDVMDTVKEWL